MASIRREISIDAPADRVWGAFRDVGAVHTKLARGFVTDCRLEDGARVVTFANGFVARELLVDVDDARRRIAYSARAERIAHHHASFEVIAEGDARTRVIWVADVLPNEMAGPIAAMMDQGCAAMKKTLESA
ncbi:SRPBCC family protein [Sandaracinus amylolyticus]|uniref:Polyketide cyclase/dehydrase n=1 Tax=Sandaracinus amylolyticus TaxID=927083 RepID=A0A0F6SD84_9BACT|nr:SRPBCC family protein [Sandaracinus amylolyticus]AKF02999.1 hypothetical protein DB32_000147 [Sandaracinus amylolyticus]